MVKWRAEGTRIETRADEFERRIRTCPTQLTAARAIMIAGQAPVDRQAVAQTDRAGTRPVRTRQSRRHPVVPRAMANLHFATVSPRPVKVAFHATASLDETVPLDQTVPLDETVPQHARARSACGRKAARRLEAIGMLVSAKLRKIVTRSARDPFARDTTIRSSRRA
jgi:hypothetical protein